MPQKNLGNTLGICWEYVGNTLGIRWEQRVTNKEIAECTNINSIDEVKQKRWRWLGRVLHRDRNSLLPAALTWTPPGKRKRGRPRRNWSRTVEEKMRMAGKTWIKLS